MLYFPKFFLFLMLYSLLTRLIWDSQTRTISFSLSALATSVQIFKLQEYTWMGEHDLAFLFALQFVNFIYCLYAIFNQRKMWGMHKFLETREISTVSWLIWYAAPVQTYCKVQTHWLEYLSNNLFCQEKLFLVGWEPVNLFIWDKN